MSEYGADGTSGDGTSGEGSGPEGFVPPPSFTPPSFTPPPTPPSTPHDAGAGGPFDITPGPDADVIGTPEHKPARRVPVILAMVAVLVLILAAGAVAFVKSSSSTSTGALTKLVPAGSYGYVQLDLKQSSSAGLFEYLSHFPGSPATKPDAHKATFRDTLLSTVFTKSDDIDYGRDIQPWLGNAAGIAVFRGSNGNPVPLVVIATTDAAKAKAGLARIDKGDNTFAYTVVDGDVLMTQHQADLDAAQSEVKSGALPSSGSYAADVATLPSGSLVTMWADLDKITAAAKSAVAKACVNGAALAGGCSTFNGLNQLGVLGGLGGSATTGGRIALGVTVSGKVATLTVRELGHKAAASSTVSVGDELKTLPADTTGAIALGDVSTGVNAAMKSLSALSGVFAGAPTSIENNFTSTSGRASSSPVPALAPSAGAASAMPAVPSLPAGMMASLQAEVSSAKAANPSAFPSGASASLMPDVHMSTGTSAAADPMKAIQNGIKAATGLSFPDDLTALLGDRTVISVGDVPLSTKSLKDLQVAIRSHPKDLAKAQALAQTLIQHVGSTGIPFQLGTKTAGQDFVLASSQSYADAVAANGTLGSNPQFQAAMGDLSAAHFAAYVDLSKFTGILSATKEKAFSGFKALGIVERNDGADAVIQLKLITG